MDFTMNLLLPENSTFTTLNIKSKSNKNPRIIHGIKAIMNIWSKKSLSCHLLFVLLFANSSIAFGGYTLGVNLVNDGAFVNIINHTNRYQNVTSFDERGWPNSDFELVLMDGRPVAEWTNSIDDPEMYRIDFSGIYKSSFVGQADINVWGSSANIIDKSYNIQTNLTTFSLVLPSPPSKDHGLVVMTFTNTRKTPTSSLGTGVSQIKVMQPGYELSTDKVFTDEYIELCKSADFSCYRYYNVQNIWSGEPLFPIERQWSDRKSPLDASQMDMSNMNGNKDGWCWEYIIKLANELGKDIWLCIHISCNKEYVKELAKLLKNELNPNINIYIENSNEVWSATHMSHGPYNQAQAGINGINFQENYARRTMDLSNWFAEVFGDESINSRIRVILAGQQAYLGRHDNHIKYIKDNIGEPNRYIYALSTAIYFGTTNPGGTPLEINLGMIEEINSQIKDPKSVGYRLSHIDKAEQYQFLGGCTSYEGGPHYPAGGNLENLNNAISSHRTPEMGDVMKMNYKDAWFDLGGGLAMQFTLASGYNRYGCWGLTDDPKFPDRNFKMKAIRDLLGEWTNMDDSKNNAEFNSIIFPNPGNGDIIINYIAENTDLLTLRLIDQRGQILRNEVLRVHEGTNKIRFSTGERIPVGVFYLQIIGGRGSEIHPLEIIK